MDQLRLALGTAQLGLKYGIANNAGQVPYSVALSMLELARSNAVDTLDTAIAYGDSEARLGAIGVQGYKVVTKLPAIPDGTENINKWVLDQITGSLKRLKVDSIYALLLHRPSQLLERYGHLLFNALLELKISGFVKKIGISIYSPSELDALIPRYQVDMVQAPFNLVDRRLLTSGWLQRLRSSGIEVHTRSAFLQGLLLMARADIPMKFAPWDLLWNRWHEWLVDKDFTALQACLAYAMSFSEIDRVVVGADNLGHLLQIINSGKISIVGKWPDIECIDDILVSPSRWSQL